MTVHLVDRTRASTHDHIAFALCGASDFKSSEVRITVWSKTENEWRWNRPPTCETCILIHWAHPENTEFEEEEWLRRVDAWATMRDRA